MASSQSCAKPDLGQYVWWFPGAPRKVHLSLDVVRRMREQLPLTGEKQPGEGLLLGRIAEGATEILDFRDATGTIREAVAGAARTGPEPLVGYYRVETGDLLRLNEQDLSLAGAVFAQPHHVFLLIQPTGSGAPNAAFFFHDHNGKMEEFSVLEFPYDASVLAGEEHDRLKRSQAAAARRSAAVQQAPDPPPPARKRRSGFLLAFVAILGALAAAGFAANSQPVRDWWSRARLLRHFNRSVEPLPRASPAPALAMDLRAQPVNGGIEITWNRQSSIVAAALSGVVSIQDGELRREIPLDARQVHTTSILYLPVSSGQVSIQLSITTSASTITESIVWVLAGAPPARPSPAAPPPAAPPGAAPPAAAAKAPPVSASIPTLIAHAVIPAAAEASPNATPDALPADLAPYRPPEVLHKVVPEIAAPLLPLLPKKATIDIRLSIDADGRVTQAEASSETVVPRAILNRILTASRAWTFRPARRGDDPVASEFLLEFSFGR